MVEGSNLPVIEAREILERIERGEPVIYEHVAIAGDIDLSRFDDARFLARASFSTATFLAVVSFASAHFQEDALFDGTAFMKTADCSAASFQKEITFAGASINKMRLSRAQISGQLSLQNAEFNRLEARWPVLCNHLRYDGETYLSLARNYRNLEWFEDADDCYYHYRRASQAGKSFAIF
ncbi:pentapeptide repeat-containing protein [Methanothrix soehngenii]|uniref:pentapeptide repeat-containing protein n=1 Tax=Methanothrix soehngenii TaxID=2223 RepID=UPI002FDB162B